MSKYTIVEGTDYYSSGCDCCQPTEWETYEVIVTDCERNEVLGKFGFKEDAYMAILEDLNIEVEWVSE